ncbi:NCS1 family transporter [Desulfitibacter alkalitolerans]|uniref:NCS1 family transporter n=1 Tax=Desulfitibacter alkalitolerans TaxID=264641 RepID=UPI000684982A|nr:NCS1 family transporter [Desulfitibacter alkalitolerans]
MEIKHQEISVSRQMVAEKYKDIAPDLFPQDTRILDQVSYTLAWVGGSVYIGVFMLGASIVPPNGSLNLFQAVIAMLIGLSAIAVCYTLNAQPGNKHGLPFVIHARPVFGVLGARLPVLIRAVPALLWYGIQTWVGASALNAISNQLFGFSNIVFYFIAFQLIQIALSAYGFKGIKWLENIGSVVIIASLIYMFTVIYKNFGAQVSEKIINIPGTWGIDFWIPVVAFIGVMSAMMLNISDYAREYHKSSNSKMFIAHWIGSVPVVMFMALIGLLAAGVTGEWDPIILFTTLLPSTFVLIVALFFVALAQVTTNIMLNVIPPTYIMMELFGFSFRKGAVITGILIFFTFPWKIMTASGFFFFIQAYSLFLGPIFAVLIVDYFFIRKGKYKIMELYDENGQYSGINWSGIIAIVFGAIIGGVIKFELAWAISLIPSGLLYYVLMKNTTISTRFLDEHNPEVEETNSVNVN